MKLQNMTTQELAKWLHDNYEEIAKNTIWNTKNYCLIPFDDLLEKNKKNLKSLARKIHKNIQ